MIQRCTNPNAPNYSRYGAKGVTVCKRWLTSYTAFYADMRQRPAGTSLDRIKGHLGYSKRNCKWSTPKEQAAHRRDKSMAKNNTSGITGVSWNVRIGAWRAYGTIDHKQTHIGYFDSLEEAKEAIMVHRRIQQWS